MSNLSINQNSRLSDSLERELLRKAVNDQSASMVTVCKNALASLKRGVIAISNYMMAVTQALDEARAKDARFSRSQW